MSKSKKKKKKVKQYVPTASKLANTLVVEKVQSNCFITRYFYTFMEMSVSAVFSMFHIPMFIGKVRMWKTDRVTCQDDFFPCISVSTLTRSQIK